MLPIEVASTADCTIYYQVNREVTDWPATVAEVVVKCVTDIFATVTPSSCEPSISRLFAPLAWIMRGFPPCKFIDSSPLVDRFSC